jgi:hypothetical protein
MYANYASGASQTEVCKDDEILAQGKAATCPPKLDEGRRPPPWVSADGQKGPHFDPRGSLLNRPVTPWVQASSTQALSFPSPVWREKEKIKLIILAP